MRLGLSYFLGLFYFNVIAYTGYSTEKGRGVWEAKIG